GQVGRGYDLQRPGARLGGGGQVHHLPEHVNDRELHDLDESRAERPVVVLRLKSGGDRGQRVEAGVVPAVARRRVDVGADRVRDRIVFVIGSGVLTRSATGICGIVVRSVWARLNVSSACDMTLRPAKSSRALVSSGSAASPGNSAMERSICSVRLTNGFLDRTT